MGYVFMKGVNWVKLFCFLTEKQEALTIAWVRSEAEQGVAGSH